MLEKPPVDRIAARTIARRGFAARVGVIASDMLTDPLPTGYDVHLFSNVLHDWDVPECERLVARCSAALPRGGRLLIHDAFLNDDLSGPLYPALFSVALMVITQGRNYSVAEYKTWLTAAGLKTGEVQPTLVHSSVLVGTKE